MADRLGAASKTVQQCAQIIFRSRISRPQPEGLLKIDRKSTRLNSSHGYISYAVFCLKKKKKEQKTYSAPDTAAPVPLHCMSTTCRSLNQPTKTMLFVGHLALPHQHPLSLVPRQACV